MRRTTVLLAVAATAVLALPLPASAVPSADRSADRSAVRSALQVPYTGPTLTSVKLSTGAVSVNGLDTLPVTVTVTATGDQGECPRNTGGVSFRRTNTHVWDRSATGSLIGTLFCVADSGGVRTYKATVPVPSTADGPWRVDHVVFGQSYYLDPRTFGLPDAALAVTGTHRPRLRINVAPQPLVYPARDVTVTVRASFDDTHTSVTTRRISITDDGGLLAGCGGCPGNTDAHGRIVRRLTLSSLSPVIADMPISGAGFYDAWPSYSSTFAVVVREPKLSASPARSRVPHGTNVGVDGRAMASEVQAWYLSPRIKVNLQRLVGRHWRTVSNSTIRPNGRFALLATPPKGRNLYRVSLPAQQNLAAATSPTFTIRGM